jgi:hypothetical protein
LAAQRLLTGPASWAARAPGAPGRFEESKTRRIEEEEEKEKEEEAEGRREGGSALARSLAHSMHVSSLALAHSLAFW